MTAYPGRLAGEPTTLTVAEDGATVGDRHLDWLDVDDVRYGAHALTFVLPDGEAVEVTHLGRGFDACAAQVRTLRGAARRPALTQGAFDPLVTFEARDLRAATAGAEPPVTDVLLFPHALTVEPRGGPATCLPLPLVAAVERDGWTLTLRMRGLDDVTLSGLGARTDELLQRLDAARAELQRATDAAYAETDPSLTGIDAPDGWALGPEDAGPRWEPMRAAWLARARGEQARTLVGLAAPDGVRLGLWTEGGTLRLPFLLAASGTGAAARVAVEAVDADDRATFVFATDDLDRLNAALVQTAFRRDALALPDAELGRWAVAVRTQPVVRWARERLVARVVHDAGWTAAVTAALAADLHPRAEGDGR